jgi:hypothetical protein
MTVFPSSCLAISPVILNYLLVVPTRSLNSRTDFTRSCFEHHSHLKHVSIVQTHPHPASKSVLFMSSSLTTCCCSQFENMKGRSRFSTPSELSIHSHAYKVDLCRFYYSKITHMGHQSKHALRSCVSFLWCVCVCVLFVRAHLR